MSTVKKEKKASPEKRGLFNGLKNVFKRGGKVEQQPEVEISAPKLKTRPVPENDGPPKRDVPTPPNVNRPTPPSVKPQDQPTGGRNRGGTVLEKPEDLDDVLKGSEAKAAYEKALNKAEQALGKVIDNPLCDASDAIRALKLARKAAEAGTEKGYTSAVAVIEDAFEPAMASAVDTATELGKAQEELFDALRTVEGDISELKGEGNVIDPRAVEQLADEARKAAVDATTKEAIAKARALVRKAQAQANVFKSIAGQKAVSDEDREELSEDERGAVDLTEAKRAWEAADNAAVRTLGQLDGMTFANIDAAADHLHDAREAAKADTAAGYRDGVTILETKFTPAADTARQDAEATADAQSKAYDAVHEAETAQSQVEDGADFCDPAPSRKATEAARTALDDATTRDDFQNVLPLATEAKRLANGALSTIAPARDAERDYLARVAEANAALQTLGSLTGGATFGPTAAAITAIRTALTNGEQAVTGATSAMAFMTGQDKLSGVAGLREGAVQAAKNAAAILVKLEDARNSAKELAKYPFIDRAAIDEQILAAEGILSSAKTAGDAANASIALNAVPRLVKEATTAGEEGLKQRKLIAEEEAIARNLLAQMKSLPGATSFNPLTVFIAQVEQQIDATAQAAAQADDAAKLPNLLATLRGVGAKAEEAKKLAPKGDEFLKAIGKAEDKLKAEAKNAFLDLTAAGRMIDEARKALAEAMTVEQAKAAVKPLEKFDAAIKEAHKPHGPALKEREEYDKFRVAAGDQLAKVLKDRGAMADPEMQRIVAEMERIIRNCDLAANQAMTVDTLKKLKKQFVEFKTARELAEKRAEALKKESQADVTAAKKLPKQLAAARKALAEVSGLPGGGAKAEQLRTRIALAEASVTRDGELAKGHGKALDLLLDPALGYEKLAAEAREESKAFAPDGATLKLYGEVESKINGIVGSAPESAVALFRSEAARGLELAATDKEAAAKALQATLGEVISTGQQLVTLELDAQDMLRKVMHALGTIQKYAPKVTLDRINATVKRAVEVEFVEREWAIATDALAPRLAEAEEWLTMEVAYTDWTKRHPEVLRMVERTKAIADGWPPLAAEALKLRGDVQKLDGQVKATKDYLLGMATMDAKDEEFTALEQKATSATPKGASLEALGTARHEGEKIIQRADSGVEGAFKKFEALPMMAGLKNKDKIKVYAVRAGLLNEWKQFAAGPVPDGDPVKTVLDKANEIATKLAALPDRLKEIESNQGVAFSEFADAIAADKADAEDGRPVRIDNMIEEAERFGPPATKTRQKLEKIMATKPPDAQALKELETELEKGLTARKNSLTEKAEKAKKQHKKFKGAIKHLNKSDFKEFYKKLSDKNDDIQALIDTGDPELMQEGIAMREQLRETLYKDLKSGGKEFKKVQAKCKEMENTLGDGNRIRHRLKDTYKTLYAEMVQARAKTMETAPEQSLKDLEPLAKKINDAAAAAKKADGVYKEYKAEHTAVVELHKTLVKETKTWITDKASAYEGKLKAKLGQAKGLAKAEGKMAEAFEAIRAIRQELEAIQKADDPRGALQKADGEAAQEQRLARDLARQYESERAAFDKLIEAAQAAAKKAKSDDGTVGRLATAAKGADKIVEPYLNAISKVPHKKLQGQDADPPATVANAFQQARKQLSSLAQAAQRLIDNPGSTEVADPGDLPAIEAEFRDRCAALHKGVKEFLAKAKTKADEAATWPAGDGAPSAEAVGKTMAGLDNAFRNVRTRFSATRLAVPLGVLKDSGTDAKARKAAREKAIRLIRGMAKDILKDDLLKELRNNPYRKLTAETSLLRTSLKSLELAVLVGV